MSSSIRLLLGVVPACIHTTGGTPVSRKTVDNREPPTVLPGPWDDKAHLYNSFVITASGNTVVVIDAYSLFAFCLAESTH